MRVFALSLIVFVIAAAGARADVLRPAYLQLTQTGADSYDVLWKVPAVSESMSLSLRPVFPGGTRRLSEVSTDYLPATMSQRWRIAAPGGLAGKTIRFEGAASSNSEVIVRLLFSGGAAQLLTSSPGQPEVTITGGAQDGWSVARSFFMQGMRHISLGGDHLLFVLGLLLIVRDRWMLIKTITAFTLAHSLTLAYATLGHVEVPAAYVNALIALSILFMGAEVVRFRRGGSSLTIRHPWVAAFLFGLVHGLGFASGLQNTGLPQPELAVALANFNVGVEAAQLTFVAFVLVLERSFRILELRWPGWVQAVPAYVIGSLGALWSIQRVVPLLFGAP